MKQARKEIKYPIGIQSFEKLREENYLYVDKTPYVYDIVKNGGYYFLSRPRRFGKSLFLSTLEAYYEGRRDLFKGLALDSLTEEWEPYPVLHLDLNNGLYDSEKGLLDKLSLQLSEWERKNGLGETVPTEDMPVSLRFGLLIENLYERTGKKVVILVDEYDKPLLNTLDNPELNDAYRRILKSFYSNLKTQDKYIKLAFITGVARFSKVSIFSDLNNLRDISFEERYGAICGVTGEELTHYFKEGIADLGSRWGESEEKIISMLKKYYDGYHFSQSSPDIYNPFSLVNAFTKRDFGRYWFESGTPTYLVTLLNSINRPFSDLAPVEMDRTELESAGLLDSNPVPVFYQSGYLTIRGYDRDTDSYLLDYPNEEVKEGFLKFLMKSYIPDMMPGSGFTMADFIRAVRDGQPEKFMKSMESLVADVPYSEKGSAEGHFQNAVYLLFTLLGFFARMERRTSDGRIDLTVETPHRVYIFEFKIDSSAEKAIEQIKEKEYCLPYAASGKEIYLIGANFDTRTRRLDGWLIETLNK